MTTATLALAKRATHAVRRAREAQARLATAKQSPTWPTAEAFAALERDLARRRAPGFGLSGAELMEKHRTLEGAEWRSFYTANKAALEAEAERQGIELDPSPLRALAGIDRVRAVFEKQFPKKNP